MFDGLVRILKNVRHIPDLRKSLLSLDALKAQEYKFSGTDGTLKVTKGSIIVLKAERTMNLYKVIRSTVIGDTSGATGKKNITRLWHMHLEHMGKQGLRFLHSRKVLPGIKHCKLNLCNF